MDEPIGMMVASSESDLLAPGYCWVAVEELKLRYYQKEALLIIMNP